VTVEIWRPLKPCLIKRVVDRFPKELRRRLQRSRTISSFITGKTQQEIAAACKGARPNHVGVVIARHKRAGRIEEREGKLYATQSTGTELRAAV
jgi:hypothetical protein